MTSPTAHNANQDTATKAPTVAQVIANALHHAGVHYVFGLPGGETVELLDALRLVGIEFVLVHNESSALFIADTYARLTDSVGVCLTTLGPGATNATVGLGHAYLDRAPLILITAQKPDVLLPDYTHQVVDLQAIFRPITKATIKVTPSNAATAIAEALTLTKAGRPGPVHLQLSNEDAGQPAHEEMAQIPPIAPLAPPSADALATAIAHFTQARRPLIVAGLGLEPQQPYALLRELAEHAQAPVITTPKGKGALADDHPLAAGVIGLMRNDPAYEVLDEADCILALGFDVVELVRPWQTDAKVIWLAPWENIDPIVPNVAELVGDLHAPLQQLIDATYSPDPTWGEARVARWRAAQHKDFAPAAAGRLLPQDVLKSLREAMPTNTNLSVDVGSHKIFNSLNWPTLSPNSFFLSNGLSSMGFGLPSTIGAHFATPDRPAVCITGDAGMAMVIGELTLVAQRNLPILIVVLNDGAIDLIRAQQVRAGKPVYGTTFDAPNFSQIAAAFNIPAARITSTAELDAELAQFNAGSGPRLIEVMLDPTSYPTTPQPTH